MDKIFETVKALCERPGPAGRGGEYNRWLLNRWRSYSPDWKILAPGNLVAKIGGSGKRILLTAHSDEIGFAVRSIHEEGFLAFGPLTPDRDGRPQRGMGLHVAGQPACVLGENGQVDGVFVAATGHATTYEQRTSREIRWRDFWVDVGCSSRAECEALGIYPGTPIIWNPPTRRLGEHRIVGKAADDRAGLAIIEMVLEELAGADPGCELWVAATVLEEINAIGSWALGNWASMRGEPFDLAVVIDVGLSCHCPSVSQADVPQKLGSGPVLVVKDNSTHYDIEGIRGLEACAAKYGIATERASYGVDGSYASDGCRLMAFGIPSVLLVFPAAFTHSPFEMIDERDLLSLVDLIHHFVIEPDRWYDPLSG
ncbi:MAG: aminopeptidase [Spirochaetales bacterium]|nr:aminopeptidase [Spirochaetales bacterium]